VEGKRFCHSRHRWQNLFACGGSRAERHASGLYLQSLSLCESVHQSDCGRGQSATPDRDCDNRHHGQTTPRIIPRTPSTTSRRSQRGMVSPLPTIDTTQEVARAYGAQCTPDFFGFNAQDELQYQGRLDASRMTACRDLLPSLGTANHRITSFA